MASLEDQFERACASRDIPHAAIMATNSSGSFRYEHAFGPRSVRDGDDKNPLELDAVMWFASCTKFMTSLAALQCVDRGQLSLDAPVYDVLPEFRDLELIESLDDDGKPRMTKHKTPITLRHLLTHSSGLSYDEMHPYILAWRRSRGKKPSPGGTVESRFLSPLLFEPGTSWMYGSSIDWAGRMVERVNDNITLQAYMEKHIWTPLGIKDMTFDLSSRPDMAARMADLSRRDDSTGKVKASRARLPYLGATDCMGGQGLLTTAPEYLKFLHGVLVNKDEQLLRRDTMDQLFSPQLTDAARRALNANIKAPLDERIVPAGGLPDDAVLDWGLGGIMALSDIPGWRSARSMGWYGLPNLTWWIDRTVGLCGIYASQLIPPADPKATRMNEVFEREMYKRYSSGKQKL